MTKLPHIAIDVLHQILKPQTICILFVLCIVSCGISSKEIENSKIPPGAWRIGDVGRVKRNIAIVNEADFTPSFRRPEALGDTESWNSYARSMYIGNLYPGTLIKITRCYTNPNSTVGGVYLECEILTGSLMGKKNVDGLGSINTKDVRDAEGVNFPAPDTVWVERAK